MESYNKTGMRYCREASQRSKDIFVSNITSSDFLFRTTRCVRAAFVPCSFDCCQENDNTESAVDYYRHKQIRHITVYMTTKERVDEKLWEKVARLLTPESREPMNLSAYLRTNR